MLKKTDSSVTPKTVLFFENKERKYLWRNHRTNWKNPKTTVSDGNYRNIGKASGSKTIIIKQNAFGNSYETDREMKQVWNTNH